MDQGKLRSLMFHAGFCNEDGGWDNRPIWEQEHDNFQRFAELIVRECDRYVAEHFDECEPWMSPGDLLKHFGVEE